MRVEREKSKAGWERLPQEERSSNIRCILKRKAADKPLSVEWAEHKKRECELERRRQKS